MAHLIFALIAPALLAVVGIGLVWALSALCGFIAFLIEQFSTQPRVRLLFCLPT